MSEIYDKRDEILIRLDQRVADIHRDMTDENGRIPKMERKVDSHGEQINFWRGAIWILAGVLTLFGGVVVAHILGQK